MLTTTLLVLLLCAKITYSLAHTQPSGNQVSSQVYLVLYIRQPRYSQAPR